MWIRWVYVAMDSSPNGLVLRINACYLSDDWPIQPQFNLWPRQRHGAALWIPAFFVYFRVQHPDQPNLLDYVDFIRRARWKAHSLLQRLKKFGNYLTVLYAFCLSFRPGHHTLPPGGMYPDAPTIQ
jgi:hypothetical protein